MRFSIASIFAACVAVAAANTVEFVSQDSTTRTVYFVPSSGKAAISSITLGSLATVDVTFPTGWIGNWYAITQGATNTGSGMLGEVAFDQYMGKHYFDISAIVAPNDVSNVKMLYPKTSKSPLSGCQTFPCSNAYNQADDIQTLSTSESTLVCLVGNKTSTSKRHARDFVLGQRAE